MTPRIQTAISVDFAAGLVGAQGQCCEMTNVHFYFFREIFDFCKDLRVFIICFDQQMN